MTKPFLCKSTLALLCALLLMNVAFAQQNLTLSNAGQTGTSGTNWSTSGTNPVTITTTGTASINTSVIVGYLNAGTSVIVNNTTVGTAINSDIIKSAGGNASLTIKDISNVKVSDNITISSTSNSLNIILWADSDLSQGGTVDDFMYCGIGTSFISNGGKIVMAGGPDDGSNGGVSGDGIPDGFAWNGSVSPTYGANNVGGLTLGPRGGAGTVISLLSSGGDIILRGSTSNANGYPGITSQGNLKIVADAGKVTVFGKSTLGHGIELTFGAIPTIAITSSSTSTPAIDIKGTTSATGYAGFWASNNGTGNILIQSTSAIGGGVSIEGTGSAALGSTGLYLANSGSSITSQVLSQSGTITLRGKSYTNTSLVLYGDVYVGNRKDATTVQGIAPAITASTANILIQADDQYSFSNTIGKNTNFNTTGALNVESYTAGYTGTLAWIGNAVFGSSFSSITMGKSTENYSFLLNNSLTSVGNITAYSSDFTLANGIGLASSGAGNINVNANGSFNTLGITRRTISTVNGNINVYADADASGNGQLDIDYVTFNPGTGNTRLRAETLSWIVLTATDKPYINGTGTFTIEPSDPSFQAILTSWFNFDQDANGIAGVTIGKSTNTGDITNDAAINVAGPVSLYGGIVSLTANITSSATGDIFIKSNTNRNLGGSIDGTASILKTAGTGTLTMQARARLNSGTITASGTGVLNVILWSDYTNDNNGGLAVGSVATNGGHFWAGGSNSNGGTYTWKGLSVGDGPSVGSLNNNYNAIDFTGPLSTNGGDVLIWGGTGYSTGISGIAIMTTGKSINTGSGNITLIAGNIAVNDISITTTGVLTLVPDAGAYPAAATWAGALAGGNFNASSTFDALLINNFASLGGLTIGYYNGQLLSGTPVVQGNTSNITISTASSIAGGITLYGNALTISQTLASTAGGNISLYANSLSVTGNLSSSGNLVIEPVTAATTIGLAGGAGTLAVTATNFTTNFVDGFSEIRIGNSTAGAITLGAPVTIQDNLRLTTSGSMALNDILTIGNNDFRFIGTGITPAANKFVKTNGVGKLYMAINNNSSKLFPVGATYSSPLTITSHIGSGDTFYVTTSDGVYLNGSTGGTAVPWTRVNNTWNIGNTGSTTGAGNVDLAFGWNLSTVIGTLTTPVLFRHDGTQWNYTPGTPTFNVAAGTFSFTNYSGNLSPFTLSDLSVTLPLTWLSFTGKKVQNTVALNWATAAEQHNAYFEVERSSDAVVFNSIDRVAAAQANASGKNEYQYTDYKPLDGRSYYRIKQTDLDGKSSYSSVVTINSAAISTYALTVSLGTNQVLLSAPQTIAGRTDLLIYDGNGRKVLQQQVQPGRNIVRTGTLMAGAVYFINVVQADKVVYSGKFIN